MTTDFPDFPDWFDMGVRTNEHSLEKPNNLLNLLNL